MNSFNHYAYGAVFDWIFEAAGGIKQKEGSAGYTDVLFAPVPDVRLGYVATGIETRHGMLAVMWYYAEDKICFRFSIPEGMRAEAILPDGQRHSLHAGENVFECIDIKKEA